MVAKKIPKTFLFEVYPMMGKYYYVIRDIKSKKMVYSSELMAKRSDAEKFGKRRTALYDIQYDINISEGL